MTLGEKIAKHRKENNYTQEQLAQILGVSRQAISKWESDIAYPETDKLIKMGRLFDCSMDYLLKDECTDRTGKDHAGETQSFLCRIPSLVQSQFRERKSQKTILGMPLYHFGRNAKGFFAVGLNAKGIVAIGVKASGLVSLGVLSMGVLSFGMLSIGLISLGVFSLGLLSVGSIAAGLFSAGAISFGIVSLGALAIGQFSAGALAIGKYMAVGDHARAMIAVGGTEAAGSLYHSIGNAADMTEAKALLDANVPAWLAWAKEIFQLVISSM